MRSTNTFFKTKSNRIFDLQKILFPSKIKKYGGGILFAFVLFFSSAFTSKNTIHDNVKTSFLPYAENEFWVSPVGPNDSIDLAMTISTSSIIVCPGDEVRFIFEVTNQHVTTVESFELTDYVPDGLILNNNVGNAGWVQTGNMVKKTVTGPLSFNGTAIQFIYFDLDSTFTGTVIENRAEISAADCDSDPNNTPPHELDSSLDDIDDDVVGGDNIIDNSFGDEDDHDIATILNDAPVVSSTVSTPSVCNFDNGTITVSPGGFVAYDWSDGGSGSMRTGLFAGLYTVTVTKSSGCTSVVDSIEVNNDCMGCEAIAGTVTMAADTFCLQADSVIVDFTDDGNSVEPQPQFITSYFLTRGDEKAILAVDTMPQFVVREKGSYRIHVKVFDVLHVPQEEVDGIVVGVTPISFLDSFLVSSGGYLCGALDTVGIPFEVGTAAAVVDSVANEDCDMANGYVLLDPVDYSYSWNDGGSGHERNDLTPGTYSVTVTGCAECQDTIQNIVVGSNCILNDTIPFILEVDSMQTICSNGTPLYFSPNTTTTLCVGGTSGGDGTYGTYTVSETGCLIYNSNSEPGSDIDTICVVVNDDMGNADTTVFIPTIICHTVPELINVPCDLATSMGQICLDIPFADINNYNVEVEGNPVQNGLVGCSEDSTVVYNYSALFAQGNFGPYDLEEWSFDGNTFSSTFQNMQELVDSMNVWDAPNSWVLNAVDFTITGGDATQNYADLQTLHPITSSNANFEPTVNTFFAGTLLDLNEGTSLIVYTRTGDNCPSASLLATVSCTACVPFLPADTVQVVAPNCNDFGDFCVNISTGDIFDYQISVDGTNYGGTLMACDFIGSNDGTNLQLSAGLHEVIFTQTITSCSDTVLVNVTCTPCPEWLPDTVTLETTACQSNMMTCINVPITALSDYQITDNGANYIGTIDTCMNGTDATIEVDTGFHEIIMLNLLSGCADTMNVTVNCIPDTIIIDTLIEVTSIDTICLDPLLVGDIADIDITCGDTTDITINYTFDTLTNCIVFEGLEVGMDSLCFRLFDSFGNRTDVFLRITVSQTCGDGFISMDSTNLGLADCAGMTELCVEIPLDEILDYTITDNGMPYANAFAGCDFDTTFSYTYFTLPGQGTAGPYNVDSWIVNGTMFSGEFMTIADLVDSLNTWDMSSVWMVDTVSLILEGGNPESSYSNMTITQVATSAFALLELNLNFIAGGTSLMIGQGNHELVFVNDTTFCQDTIQANVFCLTPEIVMDTLTIGEIDTYCVDTTELQGNVISISNTCPGESGNSVLFTTVDSSYCVNYLGLIPGDNSACIIVCDDMGLCDTTNIFVHVLVDSLALPTAIFDGDTTNINDPLVVNILGNDTINGVFDTAYIVLPPNNGTISFNPDFTMNYTPNLDFCDNINPDVFTYAICNTVGCDTATISIWVLCDDNEPLRFYNGFSPNGDNVNDNFYIQGLQSYPNNILCIFNRWGNRVYYKEGYDNTFDGVWENYRLPDGTYFYVFDDGEGNKYSGYVQIAR